MAKWKNRLVVSLIIMSSCKTASTNLQVEKILLLEDFPSGSSLEYYDNKFYLSGDDASKLLILDTGYNLIDSVALFESEVKRIAKAVKADLEASAIVTVNGTPHLVLIGSASLLTREKMLLLPVHDTAAMQLLSTSNYFNRLSKAGLEDVNIEGAASTGKFMILGNRGNLKHPYNHLVFTQPDFWLHQETAAVNTAILVLPPHKPFAGISGMAYIEEEDLLLFTASTELTGSSFDDGEIGDSYIGWIKNISDKTGTKKVVADGFINLSDHHTSFSGEKIESVCVSHSEMNRHTIHLVSDNDNGVSKLFKVSVTIN
jgi:hypothetical protein